MKGSQLSHASADLRLIFKCALEGNWQFTATVAGRYLDAKAALDAQNYVLADTDFAWQIENAPTSGDTQELACHTFKASGNTSVLKQHCRQKSWASHPLKIRPRAPDSGLLDTPNET